MIFRHQAQWVALVVSLYAIGFGQSGTRETQLERGISSRMLSSVVIVEALEYNSDQKKFKVITSDSGVIVSPNLIVTNRHVVDAGDAWTIKQGRRSWRAAVTNVDPDHDLALLQPTDEDLEGIKQNEMLNASPVSFRARSKVAKGERVYAVGSTDGEKLTISSGVVTGFREYENDRLIQTSASVYVASSGGGLFDSQGRLIGITSYNLSEGHNVNFALPSEWVQMLINPPVVVNRGPVTGESESFSRAQSALGNLQTMVFQRRLLHDKPTKLPTDRAVSWLLTKGTLECIRDAKSLDCSDNWPLWKRASLLMLDLRESIKSAQPATDELDGRFIDAARSAWSAVSDIYCANRPGGSYTDLEDKIRACPASH